MTMAPSERLKTLRPEAGWSQANLTNHIRANAAQISRYENGRITLSADVIIHLADTLDVSCDYLLPSNAPHHPLRGNTLLADRLTDTDRDALLHIVDSLLANTGIRAALNNAG